MHVLLPVDFADSHQQLLPLLLNRHFQQQHQYRDLALPELLRKQILQLVRDHQQDLQEQQLEKEQVHLYLHHLRLKLK